MKWVLLFALGGTGAVVVAMCILVLLVRHRLQRRHRVQPKVASDAPLYWILSPQAPARLHRRLVAAARAARLVAARHQPTGRRGRKLEPPTIVRLCQELEGQAQALDTHLALAGRLPARQRRLVVAQLANGVGEVERTVARLSMMSAEIAAPRALVGHLDDATDLTRQLDDLERADQELRAIEAAAGLTSSTPFRTAAAEPVMASLPHDRRTGSASSHEQPPAATG